MEISDFVIATDEEGWNFLGMESGSETVKHVHGILSGSRIRNAIAIEQDKVVRYAVGKLRHEAYSLMISMQVVEYKCREILLPVFRQLKRIEVCNLRVAQNLVVGGIVQYFLSTHPVIVLATRLQAFQADPVLYIMADGWPPYSIRARRRFRVSCPYSTQAWAMVRVWNMTEMASGEGFCR